MAKNLVRGTKHEKWFNNNTVHLHFPEGATPKVPNLYNIKNALYLG